uniref:Uncharacterized protein AlNc14C303G10397 n=1 Tax=Albugo laibachii Nc14 TaxID=890382 RepID=F0WVQ8_9STRA|nr:conserved hypothetical protein [Albugo laibachii Nc14]|eukprot:CCA25504.1 conserved hypothetical protein [Albugo laibachii Nc14]
MEFHLDDRIARAKQEAARRIAAKISSQSVDAKHKKPAARNVAIPYQIRSRIDQFLESIERDGNAHNMDEKEQMENITQLLSDPQYAEYYQRKKLLLQSKTPSAAKTSANCCLSSTMSAGALANACKLAEREGISPYTPLPEHILHQANSLSVEKDRLEARIAEFYEEMYRLED